MQLLSIVVSLLLGMILLPMSAIAARNTDVQFRDCERVAMDNRETRLIDATRNYHINWYKVLWDRRQRFFDSWGIENDKDRQNAQRDLEKNVKDLLKQNDTSYRNNQKAITNDFRNDDRVCRDQYNTRLKEVPTGLICYSSSDCRPPLGMCTTETGECRSVCRRGSEVCIQVCSGRCKLR